MFLMPVLTDLCKIRREMGYAVTFHRLRERCVVEVATRLGFSSLKSALFAPVSLLLCILARNIF